MMMTMTMMPSLFFITPLSSIESADAFRRRVVPAATTTKAKTTKSMKQKTTTMVTTTTTTKKKTSSSSSSTTATQTATSTLGTIYQRWYANYSSAFRYFISSDIGTVCFFGLEYIVYRQLCCNPYISSSYLITKYPLIEQNKETVSYFVGYFMSIVVQHLLNAILVYGIDTINTYEKYMKTLIGQFSAYGLSLVGSTILNYHLLQTFHIQRTLAIGITMSLFACINYFLISWIVKKMTKSSSTSPSPSSPTSPQKTKTETKKLADQ